jgi:AcrR family transcriptional regulator
VSVAIDPRTAAGRREVGSLRERKKDATRRALAEAAMNLAIERGYAAVTIADITEAAGVSRRTFSNYFAGKAECVAAVTEGWFDDIAESIRDAPLGHRMDELLCEALLRVAADLPERWERFYTLLHAEPELKAMVGAIDEANCEQLTQVIAPRFGVTADDIRVRMLATYGVIAGRTCLEDWVLRGRPGGQQSFQAQLDLALSIIDLTAFPGTDPEAVRETGHAVVSEEGHAVVYEEGHAVVSDAPAPKPRH